MKIIQLIPLFIILTSGEINANEVSVKKLTTRMWKSLRSAPFAPERESTGPGDWVYAVFHLSSNGKYSLMLDATIQTVIHRNIQLKCSDKSKTCTIYDERGEVIATLELIDENRFRLLRVPEIPAPGDENKMIPFTKPKAVFIQDPKLIQIILPEKLEALREN